jgi:hypothetical protein
MPAQNYRPREPVDRAALMELDAALAAVSWVLEEESARPLAAGAQQASNVAGYLGK